MHECTGATWSAVLPTDAVLAARLFARGQGNARLDRQVCRWRVSFVQSVAHAKKFSWLIVKFLESVLCQGLSEASS